MKLSEFEKDLDLPKDSKIDKIIDDAIEEVINEDYQNEHYKAQKIDTVARCKANMTLEQQKAICIFNIDKSIEDILYIKEKYGMTEALEES